MEALELMPPKPAAVATDPAAASVGGGEDDGRDPKVWRTASGDGAGAAEGGTSEAPAPCVPSPCLSPAASRQGEDSCGGCSACGSPFVSRKSVRWHPLVTLPQCLHCFARANSTLTLVLVQQHQDLKQEQARSEGGGLTRKRLRPAPIDGLVCLWCLNVLPEEATNVLRCGRGKHPLCPSRPAAARGQASRLVVCPSCVGAHAGPERAAQWRAQYAGGAWACFICDKLPLLQLALEKGWGLPSYPQDLRMSAEVQEALHKLFSTPHRLLPASSPSAFPSPSPTPSVHTADESTTQAARARHTNGSSNSSNSSNSSSHAGTGSSTPAPSPTLAAFALPPPDLGSLMGACGGDAGLISLVESTQQALSLLTRLWREAAVRVAAREDLLDDVASSSNGGGAAREAMLLAEGAHALEGEGLRRRPTVDYLTASVAAADRQRADAAAEEKEDGDAAHNGVDGEEGRAASPPLAAAAGPASAQAAEAEAQRTVRSSLAELRVLLRQMRAMNDQQQERERERAAVAAAAVLGGMMGQRRVGQQQEEAKGGALGRQQAGEEEAAEASLALDYEMERMEQLHAWLLSSQSVLRCLHGQVQEVLRLAVTQQQQQQEREAARQQQQEQEQAAAAAAESEPVASESPSQQQQQQQQRQRRRQRRRRRRWQPRAASTEFQLRLKESGESLLQLEKDLSLRLEDVSFAVSILCQMRGEADEKKKQQRQQGQGQGPKPEVEEEGKAAGDGFGGGGAGIEAID